MFLLPAATRILYSPNGLSEIDWFWGSLWDQPIWDGLSRRTVTVSIHRCIPAPMTGAEGLVLPAAFSSARAVRPD